MSKQSSSGRYLLSHRVVLRTVKGAFAGLLVWFIGHILYGGSLTMTQTNYSLNGGPGIVLGVLLGAIAG